MKVRIKKLNDKAVMPTKAHATDAGFDLYCTSKEINWTKRQLVCHTGLAFEIPEGYVGLIFPRSSVSTQPPMWIAADYPFVDRKGPGIKRLRS